MTILLGYASEFGKGEGFHFSRVLRRLGDEVYDVNVAASVCGLEIPGRVVRGYSSDVGIKELLEEHGKVDLYLYIEPMGLIPRGLESSPIPTACVLRDVHRNPEPCLTPATLRDHIFVYHRNHTAAYFDHEPAAVHWLHYASDTEVLRNLAPMRQTFEAS